MTTLSEILARAIRALVAAILSLFGAGKEAASLLADDARRFGRAARSVGEVAARVVGTGLAGPARVLDGISGGLSSLLPSGPVGPKAVADAAVEHDHTGFQIPAATKAAMAATAMAGNRVIFAAAARTRGDKDMTSSLDAELPPHVRAWMDKLTPAQVAHLAGLDVFHVAAHVEGRSLADGLPPVPAAPAPITDKEQMRATLAEIRRIARAERAAEVERATGGHRRPTLPTPDEDDYVPPRRAPQGPRPAFH